MSPHPPVHPAVRRPGSTVLNALIAILVALVVVLCVLAYRSSAGSEPETRTTQAALSPPGKVPGELPHRLQSRTLGTADGEVADRTTVFADVPGVANLDPALLEELRKASEEAGAIGIELDVNSGWRSFDYQEQLFDEAVAKYGSQAQAERWVARPGTSVHEAGEAVDIGPTSATTWLARHGAAFGLCQVYANEPWHYELRPDASDDGCPATYADPTRDPRMQP